MNDYLSELYSSDLKANALEGDNNRVNCDSCNDDWFVDCHDCEQYQERIAKQDKSVAELIEIHKKGSPNQ